VGHLLVFALMTPTYISTERHFSLDIYLRFQPSIFEKLERKNENFYANSIIEL